MTNFKNALQYIERCPETGNIDLHDIPQEQLDLLTFAVALDNGADIDAMEFIAMSENEREDMYNALSLIIDHAVETHNIITGAPHDIDQAMFDAGHKHSDF